MFYSMDNTEDLSLGQSISNKTTLKRHGGEPGYTGVFTKIR